jgi:hypothetical protein
MSVLISRVKKAAIGAAAVLAVSSGATVMSATSAEAQWAPRHSWGGGGFRPRHAYGRPAYGRPAYGYGYRGGYRPARGAAVAAGIIGGIAAGALIAGSSPAYAVPAPSYGYAPAYGYAPEPTYYQPAYETYQPSCYFKKVRQVVDYDTVVIRRVRVCN